MDWSYEADEPEWVVFWIFVYPRGETENYVEMIWAGEGEMSGTTYSYAGSGEYYVKVGASNVESWQITIRPA